ncbi:hypothetical protein HDU86_000042 [Geranomyces michiganensis]|nr:hypothetical protein HDU86_000042 [Geranomyces michiganensis]
MAPNPHNDNTHNVNISGDNDDDFDVDQLIAAELAALPPEDTQTQILATGLNHLELELIDGEDAQQLRTQEGSNAGPELEKMDSWADYLQTLQTTEDAFRRRNTEAEVLVDELLDGRGFADDENNVNDASQARERRALPIARTPPPPQAQAPTPLPFLSLASEEDQVAHERRLSDLQQVSTNEMARLEELQAEAVKAGVNFTSTPLPRLLRRETPEETTGQPAHDAGSHDDADDQDSLLIEEHSGSINSVASTDLREEERTLQQAEERHLTVELDKLIKKQREQAGEQAALQYSLDLLLAKKTASQRTIRQHKQAARDTHAKLKRSLTWLTTGDGRLAFEREKDRTAALMARLHALMGRHEAVQRHLRGVLDAKISHCAALAESVASVVDGLTPLRAQCDALTTDITRVNADLVEQGRLLEEKKAKRDFRILEELEEEEATRRRELELLLASLRRQKGFRRGGKSAGGGGGPAGGIEDLGELLSIELKGSGLGKIPDMMKAPKVRHVILDDNHLSTLQGLECLKDLRFLSIHNNRYTHLDTSLFTELRILNASKNLLTDLEPGGGDVKCEMKLLIYLDASENRLHQPHLGLSGSVLLQYLNVSGNAFMDMPEFPNDLLYEFDAHKNNIRYMNISKWAPALRIFDASFNNIRTCDPVSMAMCPFLQEVRLSNNLITDFTSLYSLAVCRDLEVMSLEANPILSSSDFYDAAAVLFPKLKHINGTPVNVLAAEFGRKSFAARSPVKIVKWCRRAVEHLHIFIENEHEYPHQQYAETNRVARYVPDARKDQLNYQVLINSIQAAWRGHKTRVRLRREREQVQKAKEERQSRASTAARMRVPPVPRPVGKAGGDSAVDTATANDDDDVADELASENDIDEWLEDLDEKKSYFLRDEQLTQFSYDEAVPQTSDKAPTQPSWPKGKDPETERFIRSQFESIQSNPAAPAIKPRTPLHSLLLNRGVVKVPRVGAAVIGHHPSAGAPASSEGTSKGLGLTADMLVTRRGHDTPEAVVEFATVLPEARVAADPSENVHEEVVNEHATAGSGWKLKNQLTQALLERKIGRDAKLHRQAETREQMKDPMVRLRVAHHHHTPATASKNRRAFGALDAAGTPGTATTYGDGKPHNLARSHVTYAWDLRRWADAGTADQHYRKTQRLPPLSYSHEIAQTQIPVCPQSGHGPTLLINNYLSNRLLQQQKSNPPEALPRVVYSTLTFLDSGTAAEERRLRDPAAMTLASSGLHTMPAYGAPLGAHSHRQIRYAFDHSETLPTL